MRNIEIKARVPDRDALLTRVIALGAREEWTRLQHDTFFVVPSGYLKLRQVGGQPAELIAYVREPGTEPRASDYDIASARDGAALLRALTRALGVRGVVEKERTLYLWRHTRIHLDRVNGLGDFMELETVVRDITPEDGHEEARHVMRALGIDAADLADRPYLELLEDASAGARRVHAVLFVGDQERSRTFYERVLGIAPSLHVPGMTEFTLTSGAVLGLMPAAGAARLLGPDAIAASGSPRGELYLLVDDPAACHARALASGASELSPLAPRDWGHDAAYALDPDGHIVAFAKERSR